MTIETIKQTPTKLTIPDHDPANIENVGYSAGSTRFGSEAQRTKAQNAPADYSFWDFLDLINPLQHIPVVNTLYREITGDTIKPEMKMAGSAILGGPLGLVSSLADVIFEQETGKDIGSTLVASVFGDSEDAPVQTARVDTDAVKAVEQASAEMSQISPAAGLPSVTGYKKDKQDEREQRLASIDPMDSRVLELYGQSNPAAASKAYQQADMRAYLQQASLKTSY